LGLTKYPSKASAMSACNALAGLLYPEPPAFQRQKRRRRTEEIRALVLKPRRVNGIRQLPIVDCSQEPGDPKPTGWPSLAIRHPERKETTGVNVNVKMEARVKELEEVPEKRTPERSLTMELNRLGRERRVLLIENVS